MFRATRATARGVLVVVDEGPAAASLLREFEAAGLSVEWAKTLCELKARALRQDLHEPDVILLDLELADGDADGEVVPLVQANFPRAVVVALATNLSGEGAAHLLGRGVPSLQKPISPFALVGLALRLPLPARPPAATTPARPPAATTPARTPAARTSAARTPPATTSAGPAPVAPVAPAGERGLHLESALRSYAIERLLSKRQQLILRHYLSGQSDKEIAYHCRCAEATVYEHWRRMARKAGGSHKGDVITDFHRFLGGY